MSNIAPRDPSCRNSIFVLGRLYPTMDDEELTCLDHLWADTHPPAKLPTKAGEQILKFFIVSSVLDGSWNIWTWFWFATCCFVFRSRLWYFCCKLNFMNLLLPSQRVGEEMGVQNWGKAGWISVRGGAGSNQRPSCGGCNPPDAGGMGGWGGGCNRFNLKHVSYHSTHTLSQF